MVGEQAVRRDLGVITRPDDDDDIQDQQTFPIYKYADRYEINIWGKSYVGEIDGNTFIRTVNGKKYKYTIYTDSSGQIIAWPEITYSEANLNKNGEG